MKIYLKQFFYIGVPVVVILMVFFVPVLGVNEGLLPELLIGIFVFVGSFVSLILGFFYSKSTKDVLSDWLKDIKARPAKKLIQIFYTIYFTFGSFIVRDWKQQNFSFHH
jgi:hypothetical protein